MKKENLRTGEIQDTKEMPAVDIPPDEDISILIEYCASVYESRKTIITMLHCVNATGSENQGLCWSLKKHVPSKQIKAPTCLSYTFNTVKHV